MPRAARIVVPEMAVHVIQRGNNHGRCFFSNADYPAYLSYLRFLHAGITAPFTPIA